MSNRDELISRLKSVLEELEPQIPNRVLSPLELVRFSDDKQTVYTTQPIYDLSLRVAEKVSGQQDTMLAQFLRAIWEFSKLSGKTHAGISKSIMDNRFKYREKLKYRSAEDRFRWKDYEKLGIIKCIAGSKKKGLTNNFCLAGWVADEFHEITELERQKKLDDLVWSTRGDLTIVVNKKFDEKPVEVNASTPISVKTETPATLDITPEPYMSYFDEVWNSNEPRILGLRGSGSHLDSLDTVLKRVIVPRQKIFESQPRKPYETLSVEEYRLDAFKLGSIIFSHRDQFDRDDYKGTLNVSGDYLNSISVDFDQFKRLQSLARSFHFHLDCANPPVEIKAPQKLKVKTKKILDFEKSVQEGPHANHPDWPALLDIIMHFPHLLKGKELPYPTGWYINNKIIDKKYRAGQGHDYRLQELATNLGLKLNFKIRDTHLRIGPEVKEEHKTDESTQGQDDVDDTANKIAKEKGFTNYEQVTDEATQKSYLDDDYEEKLARARGFTDYEQLTEEDTMRKRRDLE